MIKDIMVRLDGTRADEIRLAAVNDIADTFGSRIVGLYFNVLPVIIPEEGDSAGALRVAEAIKKARERGDMIEAELSRRLTRLQKPAKIRRFDLLGESLGDFAAREARIADTFVALRPNGSPQEPEQMVESILFGSGRHLFLVPDGETRKIAFNNILVAWNGSREAARAITESLPYLHKAKTVTVVVVDDETSDPDSMLGAGALEHLKHHGINAALHRAGLRSGGVGATLIAEAKERKADLIVMGGYGHSRMREWLLGGATYDVLHSAPMPVLVAH